MFFGRYKQNKRWMKKDARTFTLKFKYPNGWTDFLAESGIPDEEENKLIFESLYFLYGNTYLVYNSADIINETLKFLIVEGRTKYLKLFDTYNYSIEYFLGNIEKIKQYSVGDNFDNQENTNQYKTGSQDTSNSNNMDAYKKIMEIKSPLTIIVHEISDIILLSSLKDKEEDYEY